MDVCDGCTAAKINARGVKVTWCCLVIVKCCCLQKGSWSAWAPHVQLAWRGRPPANNICHGVLLGVFVGCQPVHGSNRHACSATPNPTTVQLPNAQGAGRVIALASSRRALCYWSRVGCHPGSPPLLLLPFPRTTARLQRRPRCLDTARRGTAPPVDLAETHAVGAVGAPSCTTTRPGGSTKDAWLLMQKPPLMPPRFQALPACGRAPTKGPCSVPSCDQGQSNGMPSCNPSCSALAPPILKPDPKPRTPAAGQTDTQPPLPTPPTRRHARPRRVVGRVHAVLPPPSSTRHQSPAAT